MSVQEYSNRRIIGGRFTNSDGSSLLTREVSYLNGEIDSYYNIEYNGNQKLRSTRFSAPGADANWLTPDDVVLLYTDYAPTDNTIAYIIYDGRGADGTWFTADDKVRYYERQQTDASNGEMLHIAVSLAGDDGTWFTNDDQIGWITRYGAIVQDQQQVATYLTPGADNDWFTFEDNSVYQHWLNIYDAAGNLVRYILYADTGIDGIPFTTDDTIVYYHDLSYDATGRIETVIMHHGGPGPDATWFTPDDNIHSCKQLTRDANDLPIRTTTYRTGPDLSCFTPDDIVWGYHDDVFDANNLLVRSNAYYGTGPDLLWFTQDDLIVSQREYIPQQ
ncbi:MAG: hypothetical protein OEZ43_18610 [Gammaproteobacteria bacterium]|nr:hypothetical protein [Gammaproteobacteria bacterium]